MTPEIAAMTTADAARYVSMSSAWLKLMRMQGHPSGPPYIKIGRSVRYRKGDLDDWLLAHRRAPVEAA